MKKLIPGVAITCCLLTACTGRSSNKVCTTHNSETYLKKIKQVALSSDSAFIKRDITTSIKNYAPGFKEYSNEEAKPMTDMDSIKIFAKSFLNAFPDFKGENLHAVADDSTVIITGDWSGTFKNEFMKVKPTNKAYKIADADIFTFNKDGKITSHRAIQSDVTFFYQLGIPMPPKK